MLFVKMPKTVACNLKRFSYLYIPRSLRTTHWKPFFLFSCTAKDTGARVYKITYKICSRLGERYFIRNAAFRHLKELVTFSHLAVCDLVQLALPPSFGRKSYWARFSVSRTQGQGYSELTCQTRDYNTLTFQRRPLVSFTF